jgi:CRISPR-associated protein Cas5h
MKAIQFEISGQWGHFRKTETNNNPLSHDFITKTALVGVIGAVVGIEREPMRRFFPILCDALLYGVEVRNVVKKQSWGFTLRSASNLFESSPRYMEILSMPKFSIVLACRNGADTEGVFEKFCEMVKNQQACFTPVLGLHNCPAELIFENEGEIEDVQSGNFKTLGFISPNHKYKITGSLRMGFERVPTFQTDDFWNLPESYKQVIYPTGGNVLNADGSFHTFKTEKTESQWHLI